MKHLLNYSPEVAAALKERRPVLALESTIITHGLPYPDNYQTALQLEALVREQDVTPATIALINGRIHIGLSDDDLKQLVETPHIRKASRRDLAFLLASGESAGTTVAATLFCARLAKLSVFATGGIGGVHRGNSGDISADLIELARTPMAVVCAGAKAILDLPRTLEYLETHSVPVIGYRTDCFPAFYSARSTHVLHDHVETIDDLATIIEHHLALDQASSILVANPVPIADEIPHATIEPIIQESIQHAQQANVQGKALTPFLLQDLAQRTAGASVRANLSLIKNNVSVGAQLAKQLSARHHQPKGQRHAHIYS